MAESKLASNIDSGNGSNVPQETLKVPDVRLEQSFNNALQKEAEKQRVAKLKKEGLDDSKILQIQKNEPATVTKYIVWKVILRDMILMPFIQGALFTGLLMAVKPWLRGVVGNGRRFGSYIYKLVLGKDLVKPKDH
ncbi:hypothetical protein TPHA_0C04520 [Tetrapisispora phaffii CBS 4417]|uniref:Uncharacterized protein n=1 Tax=Tetrapisispora phaffii (strain ATCC 24235 / CBS 4417 / NBRC 1672 / NRRL Y-8282 / UCD 70-5) TaxID=1071381 RepID=G8BQU1_TETPH|nr:hypothetical protein TPHA_0C04520 [Tetrapisispora phaffii CBS 4417]CCE62603.1 hypothetical protein TPHA_0C04520 [Tetrapisispora phaffii CBS 4417]